MASNLIRHLPRSYKQSPINLNLQRVRNTSTSAPSGAAGSSIPSQSTQPRPSSQATQNQTAPQIMTKEGSGRSNMALGLALGLSLSVFLNESVRDRLFPKKEPPKPEQTVPSIDPKLLEHVISQDRKVNQLENMLSSLCEDIRERERLQQASQSVQPVQRHAGSGNVFELSEVIQANNMASEARYSKELEEQRKLMMREHLLKVEGEILKVENKYRPTINKIRELEAHLENQRQVQQKEAPARLLWLSCQSLLDRLRDAPQQPLKTDQAYEVLKKFAANDNQLAISILDAIPAKVLEEGVQSEETLTERYQRLEQVCKRVAMVDSHGGGLGKYLLSYLQSLFIIMDRSQSILDEEIRGQKLVDPSKWTTFDILERVRYCLGRKNLEQAIRYANQLKGQARVVARDWINDARLHLMIKQSLKALSAHAEAIAVDTTRNGSNHARKDTATNMAS